MIDKMISTMKAKKQTEHMKGKLLVMDAKRGQAHAAFEKATAKGKSLVDRENKLLAKSTEASRIKWCQRCNTLNSDITFTTTTQIVRHIMYVIS